MKRKDKKSFPSGKHWLLMLLCCLIPLAAFAAIRLFDVPLNSVLYVGLLILCPVSHFIMMAGIGKSGHESAREESVDVAEPAAHRLTTRAGPHL